MPASYPTGSDELADLFVRVRPQLEQILARYRIEERVAEQLLREVVLEFVYKGTGLEDLGARMPAALRKRCRRHWVDRRHHLLAVCSPAEVRRRLRAEVAAGEADSVNSGEMEYNCSKSTLVSFQNFLLRWRR